MMQLEENRSQIWFKVLLPDGKPIDHSKECWSLPDGALKGKPMNFMHQPALSNNGDNGWAEIKDTNGTWLVSDPTKFYSLNSGMKIYVAQLLELPQREELGIVWVQKVCLIRVATNLDLRPFGIHRAFQQNIN